MKPHITLPCPCEHCTLANTSKVVFAGTKKHPGAELHGVDATRYLQAQQRGTERVGEIGARLRADLLRRRE